MDLSKKFDRWLTLYALRGGLFGKLILRWQSDKFLNETGPHSSLRLDICIPDLSRPLPPEMQGGLGSDHELMPLRMELPSKAELVGSRINGFSSHLGSYGMGGVGILGLQLDDQWLIICLDGAGNWVEYENRMIEDYFYEDYDRGKPWVTDDADEISGKLAGSTIVDFDVQKHSMAIQLDTGSSILIHPDASRRPLFEGTKRERVFLDTDDLRHAITLSPTGELYA